MEKLIGIKCKVDFYNLKSFHKNTKYGIITYATKYIIVITYENGVRESFNAGSIIADTDKVVSIRNKGEWIGIKELLGYGETGR